MDRWIGNNKSIGIHIPVNHPAHDSPYYDKTKTQHYICCQILFIGLFKQQIKYPGDNCDGNYGNKDIGDQEQCGIISGHDPVCIIFGENGHGTTCLFKSRPKTYGEHREKHDRDHPVPYYGRISDNSRDK